MSYDNDMMGGKGGWRRKRRNGDDGRKNDYIVVQPKLGILSKKLRKRWDDILACDRGQEVGDDAGDSG